MRYFKLLTQNGQIVRLDGCTENASGGLEIGKEEYTALLAGLLSAEKRPQQDASECREASVLSDPIIE